MVKLSEYEIRILEYKNGKCFIQAKKRWLWFYLIPLGDFSLFERNALIFENRYDAKQMMGGMKW